jgi:hypothetical protein
MKLIRIRNISAVVIMIASTNLFGAADPRTIEGSGASYAVSSGEDLAKLDVGADPNAVSYTQDGLAAMTSEQLDVLYARSTSGPIPHGFYGGSVMIPPDRGLEVVKPILGFAASTNAIKKIAEQLWAGKFFDRNIKFLQNRILLDAGFLGIPKKINDHNMLFPAKLYCGQSLFDSRRESIIIDYKYGEADWPMDLPAGFFTEVDRRALNWIAGPKGLLVRDEIRMVNPGLYLGRAYLQGVFGLYFILKYDPASGGTNPNELVQQHGDECWIGHQRQKQLGKKQSDYVNN